MKKLMFLLSIFVSGLLLIGSEPALALNHETLKECKTGCEQDYEDCMDVANKQVVTCEAGCNHLYPEGGSCYSACNLTCRRFCDGHDSPDCFWDCIDDCRNDCNIQYPDFDSCWDSCFQKFMTDQAICSVNRKACILECDRKHSHEDYPGQSLA